MRKIGAHVSAAGGLDKAIERAAAIGANCVQVFSGSPRVWARVPLDKIDTNKLFSKQQELSISPIITHAIYLTNLASTTPELVKKSMDVLTYDLSFDSLVKGSGVVVHLGSHQGRGWVAARDRVAEAITKILEATPADSHFLIENSAGQNGKLCSDLSEIRWLLDQVRSPRLGWCFDTCHAHASGYALGEGHGEVQTGAATSGQVAMSLTPPLSAAAEIARLDLWSTLKCIHVNDSRDGFASGRDRHANLGDGSIPPTAMREFLNLTQVQDLPLILEVPGLNDEGPDAENIKRLKKLVE